tara:strand:+ start:306 stop:1166 length:861 start_codon:yes stop_codon:yes gene_type:complete
MTITTSQAIESICKRLNAAGIDSARLDARLIVADSVGVDIKDLINFSESCLSIQQLSKIESKALARSKRQPMDKIRGLRGFWDLEFLVTKDTMSPRPDSEALIEAVIKLRPDRLSVQRILDIGTGTGCLLLSLLKEYHRAWGLGIDKSEEAILVASTNASAAKLCNRSSFIVGNWTNAIDSLFDLVVANPPYIPTNDIETLDPEVALHEPRMALDGGEDGVTSYRLLANALPKLLPPSGLVVFEIGHGQANTVNSLMESRGFKCLLVEKDLGGIPRALCYAAEIFT